VDVVVEVVLAVAVVVVVVGSVSAAPLSVLPHEAIRR